MGFLSGISSFVKEHSDVIHGVLDVAGFIPGIGAVADAANAVAYAIEGNWLEAGISLVSAIPGIGDTVAVAKKSANAVKVGLKGVKELNAIKKAKGMKALFGVLRGKAKTGATKKLRSLLDKADETFNAIKKKLKKECTGARCFSGDTLVCTSKGYQPIKEIQKGDDVFSRNPETGEVGFRKVEDVFRTTTHTVYHIWVNGKEEFKTTAYHPIYVEDQGWITAINLREGDMLETADGPACITKIVKERHEEPVPMYNMHVKDWVSYFVGKIKAYVHNGVGDHKHAISIKRPTWRQSEIDAAKDFPDYYEQVSFLNGKPEKYSVKGTVRPDLYKPGNPSCSIDVKNYDITKSDRRSKLAKNIQKQYYKRLVNLPEGTIQKVLIDLRGQDYSIETIEKLVKKIGGLTDNGIEIIFKKN